MAALHKGKTPSMTDPIQSAHHERTLIGYSIAILTVRLQSACLL